ncbi:MAG: glycine cleavage system aminomethyltransferase GcvT [Candidatus Caldarchaeum sp.]
MKEIPLLRYYQSNYPSAEVGEFAGWRTIIAFTSLREEHKAVRESSGIFDISHMTRTKIAGSSSTTLLQKILTIDVERLKPGRMKYGLMLNEDAGIIDDVTVFKLQEDSYVMVSNAVSRERVLDWVAQHAGPDVYVEDFTERSAFFAVQGPRASDHVSRVFGRDFSGLKWFAGGVFEFGGCQVLLTRSGYTGGDGYELMIPCGGTVLYSSLWRMFVDGGVKPCGLACRDACRLEAGYLLAHQDFDEAKTPVEAGLMWAVNLEKKDFVGKKKLEEKLRAKPSSTIAILEAMEPGVPRAGYPILDSSGKRVGVVTSGGYIPSVGKGLALGEIPAELHTEGTVLYILARNATKKVVVRKQPLFKPVKA